MPFLKPVAFALLFIIAAYVIYAMFLRKKTIGMDQLLQQEHEKQQQTKYGHPNPTIEVITDRATVKQLRAEVLRQIAEAKSKAASIPVDEVTKLAQQYRRHEAGAVPAIVAILQGNNSKQRIGMMEALGKKSDDPDDYTIKEPAISGAILQAIERPEEEKTVVQVAGFMRVPGYIPVFQQRLLSGHSTDEGRIFYWLSHTSEGVNSLPYIKQKIRAKQTNEQELDWFISGLQNLADSGSTDIQNKVGDLAIYIYNNHLLNADRYEDLKTSVMTSDAAETVLACIFKYGDIRAIPIAKDIIKRKIRIEGPVLALLRLEGAQHLDKVRAYLASKDDFFTGLSIIEMMDHRFVTDKLLQEVLLQWEKRKDIADTEVDRVAKSFEKLGATAMLEHPETVLHNLPLANRLNTAYKANHTQLEDVLPALYDAGLIPASWDKPKLEALWQKQAGSVPGFVYDIFEQQHSLLVFDSEADEVPVPYDSLLYEFAAQSKGLLGDILVWMDATETNNGMQYKVTVVTTDKAYIIHPEENDDWFDVQQVETLVNRILADKNSTEKFIPVDTGDQMILYVFGDPAKLAPVLAKYKLY